MSGPQSYIPKPPPQNRVVPQPPVQHQPQTYYPQPPVQYPHQTPYYPQPPVQHQPQASYAQPPAQYTIPQQPGFQESSVFKIPPSCIYRPSSGMGQVKITLRRASNLVSADINGFSDPYCVVRAPMSKHKPKTKVIQKNLDPVWDETLLVDVSNPQYDLIVVEVMDKDTIGKDDSIGYITIIPEFLPKGVEVTTRERLSFVSKGEIEYSITSLNFGVENLTPTYVDDYIAWRTTLPPVSKKGKDKSTKKPTGPKTHSNKPPGPYSGKVPPAKYKIINGWVKKEHTESDSSVKKAGKKVFGIVSSLVE